MLWRVKLQIDNVERLGQNKNKEVDAKEQGIAIVEDYCYVWPKIEMHTRSWQSTTNSGEAHKAKETSVSTMFLNILNSL